MTNTDDTQRSTLQRARETGRAMRLALAVSALAFALRRGRP
jgi:hypothetical protein